MRVALTENLALLANAPAGVTGLRQLIRDLAVGGQLFPESRPEAWPIVQLSELAKSFQNGVSSRGASNGVPVTVLRLADIKNGRICLDDPRQLMLDEDTIEKYRLAVGDVLVIRVNGSADLVGRFVVCESGVGLHCDHFIRLRLDLARVSASYLKLIGDGTATRSKIQDLFVSTAGQKTVNQTHIGSLSFPLPPLAEQHRIVAKVYELMALCDRLETRQQNAEAAHARLVQALLDRLTQARDADEFQECWQSLATHHFEAVFAADASVEALKQTVMQLGVEGRLSNGVARAAWRYETIDSFCTVQGGIQKTPLRAPVRHHYPYLRVANVQRGRIDVAQLERYELAPDELTRWRLNAGDLLIVEGNGSENEIGRCAIWRGDVEDCVYQNHLMRVRPTGDDAVEYLALYLNSPVGKAHMRRLAITTSGLFNLSVGKIRGIPVELPPPDEQHRIVAKVTELLALCDQLKTRIAAARDKHAQLAQAIVAEALTP